MKHQLQQTSVLCLASFVLSLSAHAAFTRLATETYPGGGGGPTGGVTKAYVDAQDLSTLNSSKEYTDLEETRATTAEDGLTSALAAETLSRIAGDETNAAAVVAASIAATNYTDSVTNALLPLIIVRVTTNDFVTATNDLWLAIDTNATAIVAASLAGTNYTDTATNDLSAVLMAALSATNDLLKIYADRMGSADWNATTAYAKGNFVWYTDETTPENTGLYVASGSGTNLPPPLNPDKWKKMDNANAIFSQSNAQLSKNFLPWKGGSNAYVEWQGQNVRVYNGGLFARTLDLQAGFSNLKAYEGTSPYTSLPDYLRGATWNTAADPFAKKSDVDASTLTATNFVKANYLPLDGSKPMEANTKISFDGSPDEYMVFGTIEANKYGIYTGGPLWFGSDNDSFGQPSRLIADGTPVVTSNMMNNAVSTNTIAKAKEYVDENYLPLTAGTDHKLKGDLIFTYDDGGKILLPVGGDELLFSIGTEAGGAVLEVPKNDYFIFSSYSPSEPSGLMSFLYPDDTPVLTAKKAETDYPAITNSYPFALGNMVSNTVSQWEGYWTGSNVYWEVTNYLDSADAKIMRLMEIQTNGVVREVWNDTDKYTIFFTNTLEKVENTNAYTRGWVGEFVTNSLADKADRAWGNHTSAGADAPTNMVWHTAPTTVFAGGFEFSKVAIAGGEIGVLVSKGCVPYAAGAEGKFIIGDGFGTNYFGFVKKDDYIIATRVDGIEVDQATKMVTLTYDLVFSGEYPIVYYSPSVIPITAQTWIQLNKADGTLTPGAPWPVTFSAGAGYIKAHISFASSTPEMPPEGFFTSSTAVIGGGTFKTNMKADFLDAGIMCTNTDTKVMGVIRPTFDGTTVHWNWSKQ